MNRASKKIRPYYVAILIAVISFLLPHKPALAEADPYQSEGLLQDVISSVKTPHAFDWRQQSWEFGLRYGYFDESNSFENEVYEMMFGAPTSGGWIFRFILRRVNVYPTRSTSLLGRTPFTQDAGQTRWAAGFGLGFGLMEGKSITRLSPWIPDLEHSLRLIAVGSYNHPNKGVVPAKSDTPDSYPGQNRVNSKYVAEIGIEWQLYFPNSWGIHQTAMWHKPIGKNGYLSKWWQYSTGLTWSF